MPYKKRKSNRQRLLEMAQAERTHAATLRRLHYQPDVIQRHIENAKQLEAEARQLPHQFTIPWSD